MQEAIEGGSGTGGTTEEWPEFVAPTGAHNAYQVGDKITYNGVHYVCTMVNCVWSPDVYPAGWEAQP